MIDPVFVDQVLLPVLTLLGSALVAVLLGAAVQRAILTRADRCPYGDPACGCGHRCHDCWADDQW